MMCQHEDLAGDILSEIGNQVPRGLQSRCLSSLQGLEHGNLTPRGASDPSNASNTTWNSAKQHHGPVISSLTLQRLHEKPVSPSGRTDAIINLMPAPVARALRHEQRERALVLSRVAVPSNPFGGHITVLQLCRGCGFHNSFDER